MNDEAKQAQLDYPGLDSARDRLRRIVHVAASDFGGAAANLARLKKIASVARCCSSREDTDVERRASEAIAR